MADQRSREEISEFRLDFWLVENSRQSEATERVTRGLNMVYISPEYVELCKEEISRCKWMTCRGEEYAEFQNFWENLLEYWATRYEKWGNHIYNKAHGKEKRQ